MSGERGKVVVAMSGGVDSSVAACLLHEQGYEVIGLFMRTGVHTPEISCTPAPRPPAASVAGRKSRAIASAEASRSPDGRPENAPSHPEANESAQASSLALRAGTLGSSPDRHRGCCSADDASDARAVAGRLGIPFFALNFEQQFSELIDHFAAEYSCGRTPNPCILCNQHLKFGRLADYARAAGVEFIATGHYARIERNGADFRLCRAFDKAKDQSYVLFGIGREMLAETLFPIGGMTKDQVRTEARRFGLRISDKRDSVDICFAPDRDYARVVRERRPEVFRGGEILDASGQVVGRHGGIPYFTIGQRRGIGVAVGLPVYVTRIEPETNTVHVGGRSELSRTELTASEVRWLVDAPTNPLSVEVKIRYTHAPAPASVEPLSQGRVRVRFREPQFAITPGQAAVFYAGETVLGGGWID